MVDMTRPPQRLPLQLAVLFAPFVAIGGLFVIVGRIIEALV